ncbi:MAG TPA: glycosyltransferase [Thermoanaerobaculia bacterium]|nr:glycosyltransferase [Thermoanaerobaculia bacterium]
MSLSVVIPTHGRRAILARVLDALAAQAGEVAELETIVVDDGSRDDTQELLGLRRADAANVAVLRQKNAGPACARNAGAAAARGARLVFLGDDTVPEPGFLATHAAPPERGRPVAVLGYTTWDTERMRVTPFLTHLNERGAQFGYALIADPEDVPFNFFYTSNVSLPRDAFFALGGFDVSFPSAAWEDVELAYRASRAKERLLIVYRPSARARHEHPTTLESVLRRQRASGRAAALFARKHPELSAWLGVDEARMLGWSRPLGVAAAARALAALDPLGLPLPRRVYDKVLRRPYLEGLREALAEASRASERGDARGAD